VFRRSFEVVHHPPRPTTRTENQM